MVFKSLFFLRAAFGKSAGWKMAAWVFSINVTELPIGWPLLLDLLSPGFKVGSMNRRRNREQGTRAKTWSLPENPGSYRNIGAFWLW